MLLPRPPAPRKPEKGRRPGLLIALTAITAAVAGCAWVPQGRIEDCRQRVQVLQATNQELRDVAVHVRQENKDLAQRSLDDTRRLRAQEEAIRRYERSIADYQSEREQLYALLDQIRGQVRTAALAPPTTAMIDRLEEFVREHPNCRLEPSRGILLLPADTLFAAGDDRLTDDGKALLDALAASIGGSEAPSLALRVTGAAIPPTMTATDGDVHLASTDSNSPTVNRDGPRVDLDGLDRARRVRDLLADRLGIEPSRIAVSGGGTTVLDHEAPTPGSRPAGLVAIQVRRIADPEPMSP